MRKKRNTYLSAFSGLGGLDLGLEMAGLRNVGCIELDPIARQSLKANRRRRRLVKPHDITVVADRLKPRDVGLRRRELFMLAGGPPCQPFSKAAQWSHRAMQGLKDPRSKCFAGFIRLVESFLPEVVLIENVQGFVAGRTKVIGKLRKSFRQINHNNGTRYRLQYWVVDASDYGVPQRRKRAILIAHRNGTGFKFPNPTHSDKKVTAWEAFRHIRRRKHYPERPGNWGDLLPSIPEGQNYLWHTRKGGGRPLFGYRTRFWSFLLKLAKNQPAWTIPAQPGPYTGPFHWENRPLTEAELLRLQSFPASWRVAGNRSDRVRQIGNATPPLLAEVIGRAILEQLAIRVYRTDARLRVARSRNKIPAAEDAKPLPAAFKRLVKRRPDHPGTGRGPRPISTPNLDDQTVQKAA